MGNCCGKADRKNKKKEIKQPEQLEESATNVGGVKDTPFVNKPDKTQDIPVMVHTSPSPKKERRYSEKIRELEDKIEQQEREKANFERKEEDLKEIIEKLKNELMTKTEKAKLTAEMKESIANQSVNVKEFLSFPSPTKLHSIDGDLPSLVRQELGDGIKDIDKTVATLIRISTVVTKEDKKSCETVCQCADNILEEAFKADSNVGSLFANAYLVYIGLLKGEDKKYRPPSDITGPLIVLEHIVKQTYFPHQAKRIISAFMNKPHSLLDKSFADYNVEVNKKDKETENFYRGDEQEKKKGDMHKEKKGENKDSSDFWTTSSSESSSSSEKTRPFESYYTESSAREDERRQFTTTWGQDAAPPGNFIDTREHIQEYVFESGVRNDAARWVCMICFPGGNGTGFRVGPRHIMTANHVVKHILDSGYRQVGHNQDPFTSLQSPGVHAIFNFTTDGPVSERQKFRFKAVVPFYDDATDCAVLELEDNSMGTEMPLSFTFFSLPRLNNKFTFIGHSLGSCMEFNHVDRIIDLNSAETQRDIIHVKQTSLQHSGKDYEMPPHNILTNPNRFLFHCKFTKGASGSPGVVILPDGHVVVVTMLLWGLPDWYYDPAVQDNVKSSWPKHACVEQGVNLKSVYEKMSRDNPTLCQQIFSGHLSIPNPNI